MNIHKGHVKGSHHSLPWALPSFARTLKTLSILQLLFTHCCPLGFPGAGGSGSPWDSIFPGCHPAEVERSLLQAWSFPWVPCPLLVVVNMAVVPLLASHDQGETWCWAWGRLPGESVGPTAAGCARQDSEKGCPLPLHRLHRFFSA